MPYIDQDRKHQIDDHGSLPANPGELNYVITKTVVEYMLRRKVNYATMNEIIGVLDCAKFELYRRVVAVYENTKKDANGDVYPTQLLAAL